MKQRSIVLVPFPYSDQLGVKIRPALVISNDEFNNSSEDLIVCAVTTNLKLSKYSLILDEKDFEQGILYQISAIKTETLFKVKKSLIIETIALINKATFSKVNLLLTDLFKV